MNLLRPIAFGFLAVSVGAQAQLRPTSTNEPKVCPAPGTPEAHKLAFATTLSNAAGSYLAATEVKTENKNGGDKSEFSEIKTPTFERLSLSSDERVRHNKFEIETRVGAGLSDKGDMNGSNSIFDTRGSVKGRMFLDNESGTYIGLYGSFKNYFDNVDAVQGGRTDESAVSQGVFAGGEDCFGTGYGWEASFVNSKDDALGMDLRRRAEAVFVGKMDLLANWTTKVGLYNEDVEFGGGSETNWGLTGSIAGEIPVGESFALICGGKISMEEASSINEYSWYAGANCKKLLLDADLETTFNKLNRDGDYSSMGDDNVVKAEFVWRF